MHPMENPSLSSVEEAVAAAVSPSASESEQLVLNRKELAKYKDTYKRFWASLFISVFSFLMTFGLLLFFFLARHKKPTMAREAMDWSLWWIIIFVVNTPRHMRVYGWRPPDPPIRAKQMVLAAPLP